MKITNKYTTTTYETSFPGFYVDMVRFINEFNNEQYDAFIWEESYGVKMLMFGTEIGTDGGSKTFGDFKETVECNLEEYIDVYRDEYMD